MYVCIYQKCASKSSYPVHFLSRRVYICIYTYICMYMYIWNTFPGTHAWYIFNLDVYVYVQIECTSRSSCLVYFPFISVYIYIFMFMFMYMYMYMYIENAIPGTHAWYTFHVYV